MSMLTIPLSCFHSRSELINYMLCLQVDLIEQRLTASWTVNCNLIPLSRQSQIHGQLLIQQGLSLHFDHQTCLHWYTTLCTNSLFTCHCVCTHSGCFPFQAQIKNKLRGSPGGTVLLSEIQKAITGPNKGDRSVWYAMKTAFPEAVLKKR